MNLSFFENSSVTGTIQGNRKFLEGALISELPEDVLREWWEKSGWNFQKLDKTITKLAEMKVKFLPPFSVSQLLDTNQSEDIEYLFYLGDLKLLRSPSISIVGTRSPTKEGVKRAIKITRQLVNLKYVVMSGLAKGIDKAAHQATIDNKGKTIAILGAPFHKIYPNENVPLFNRIIDAGGLCLTPAMPYQEHGTWLFPRRNKLMAILSQATIVIEAGATSGVKHQAAECLRKKRKLIFLKSLADKPEVTWVQGFIKSGGIVVEDSQSLESALI
ncbi:MAG: hypothetical protein BWY41_00148 [Candidatus Atribacteria bacterium ADurb.Bin276]|uniref:Smf/DprA SLOG domain-containing protein n=1 Tax=Candidatus Atribacter allofermentans TaxID=1852833 RepID=A0A1V5T410_9BACT|nr:MAG: hypothetical protein BWY41_00148 [Candidatus Atribacteria bacterium ADurb.Bin276]